MPAHLRWSVGWRKQLEGDLCRVEIRYSIRTRGDEFAERLQEAETVGSIAHPRSAYATRLHHYVMALPRRSGDGLGFRYSIVDSMCSDTHLKLVSVENMRLIANQGDATNGFLGEALFGHPASVNGRIPYCDMSTLFA